DNVFELAITIARDVQLDGEDVGDVVARTRALNAEEAADQKPGTEQEHQRDGDFRDDQEPAHPALPGASGGLAALFQNVGEIRLTELQSGQNAKQNTGDSASSERKGKSRSVEMYFRQAGQVAGFQAQEQLQRARADENPGNATHQRKDQRFGQNLAHQP